MPKILRVRAAHDKEEERWVHKLAMSRHGPADWILHARMVARSCDGERVEAIVREGGRRVQATSISYLFWGLLLPGGRTKQDEKRKMV